MASLTYVCMWSDNNWKHITAEEAAQLHPGGTVSANSGLFMCELCGQYVTLVDGDRMVRHFRHSAAEKSKDCPERTFGAGYVVYYKSNEYDLPLRLVNISPTDFRFELGLISIPDELISSSMRITVSFPNVTNNHFTYSGERLNQGGITYLNVGDIPHEACILLAGPNAQDIADAFSAALFGKTAGKLCCAGEYSSVAIDSCLNSDDEVVVITEPFAPGWITKLPEIIRTESKFFFAIYPYAEDVLIEPKSIYSSFLPIFTEFLVDNVPSGTFGGGKPAKAFKDYQPRKADKLYPKALNILRTGMLIKNRMQRVLTNMEYLLDDKSADNAFLLSILPYAYATMQIGTLAEFVKNEGELHLSSEMSRYVGNLFGEFE